MSRSQREKGARGERDLAQALTDATGEVWQRTAQRTGKTGCPDVQPQREGSRFKHLHFESKRRPKLAVRGFMEQAVRDSAASGRLPIVAVREDGRTDFLLVLRLSDMMRFEAVLSPGYDPEAPTGGYFTIGASGLRFLDELKQAIAKVEAQRASSSGGVAQGNASVLSGQERDRSRRRARDRAASGD